MKKKSILLLGATGSIGTQTIDIIRQFSEKFFLVGIAGGKNIKGLQKIQKEFEIEEKNVFVETNCNVSLQNFIKKNPADIYINAISGMAGIPATEKIIDQKNPLCLANKESLVAKGKTIMQTKKCQIIPIDSEHSSMANLLSKVSNEDVKKIWLTASGGPFRDEKKFPKEKFLSLSAKDALNHPTWSMGEKISIDSATLMNKAFELIEAVRLFDFPVETYKIVVHPQSIIHAAVETKDGNILMEASTPSMHLPIAKALFEAIGEKIPVEINGDLSLQNPVPIESFSPFGKNLSFEDVDIDRFPSIEFAKKALKKGENKCRQLLQKNDESVELFLEGKISFAEIFERIEEIF